MGEEGTKQWCACSHVGSMLAEQASYHPAPVSSCCSHAHWNNSSSKEYKQLKNHHQPPVTVAQKKRLTLFRGQCVSGTMEVDFRHVKSNPSLRADAG